MEYCGHVCSGAALLFASTALIVDDENSSWKLKKLQWGLLDFMNFVKFS